MKLNKIFASLILFLAIANSSLKAAESSLSDRSAYSKVLQHIKADPIAAAVSVGCTAAVHSMYYSGNSSFSYNPLVTFALIGFSEATYKIGGEGVKDIFNGVVGKTKVTIAECSAEKSDPGSPVLAAFAHSIYDSLIAKGGANVAIASLSSYLFYDSLQARSADLYSFIFADSYTEQAIMGSLLLGMYVPKIISHSAKVAFAGVSKAITLTKGLFGF